MCFFLSQGSGWRVMAPLFADLQILECPPLAGGRSCGAHEIAISKKGVTVAPQSIQSDEESDGRCFYLALAMFFCQTSDEKTLDDFVSARGYPAGFDVKVQDISKVETDPEWKKLHIAVQVVYKDDGGQILPIRSSPIKTENGANEIVLMLFHTICGGVESMHYALVRDPIKLFRARAKTSGGNSYSVDRYICWNCFNGMWSKSAYENHKKFCNQNETRAVLMPEKGEVITFEEEQAGGDGLTMHQRTFLSAYLLFFDFETLQKKSRHPCSCPEEVLENTRKMKEEEAEWEAMSEDERAERVMEMRMEEGDSEEEEEMAQVNHLQDEVGSGILEVKRGRKRVRKTKPGHRRPHNRKLKVCEHKTTVLYEQVAFMYSYVICNREGEIVEEGSGSGDDCVEKFLENIVDASKRLLPSLSPGVPMNVSSADRLRMLKKKDCYICNLEMSESDKVVDHDHLTGKVLGVAHSKCNLARRERHTLTAFSHNFSGYDSHLLIKTVGKRRDLVSSISAIPLNTQKFKCLTINKNIRFLDSLAFLPDSLAKLADTLKASGCAFDMLNDMVTSLTEKELLIRKGVYPYSFATSERKLWKTYALPSKREFVNDLDGGSEISDDDYVHAQHVWHTFRLANMHEYTLIYCKTDVRLLAEAVMDLRSRMWEKFGLDICAYLSLPMMTKDIMLKYTGVCIELMHDQEMSNLVQNNIRGGLSFINTRSAGSMSRQAWKEDGINDWTLCLLDANNLYGKGELKWLNVIY